MANLKERYETPIQFIADRGKKITISYNVLLDTNHIDHDQFQVNHSIPSKYLINKEGIIVWRYIGEKTDRPTIELMMQAIEENI